MENNADQIFIFDETKKKFIKNNNIPNEDQIISNWKKPISNPIVTIFCNTYNHSEFIADALDSFLCQETDFSFEIIARDDASSDGTSEIIMSYAKKYPSIIKPFLNSHNRFTLDESPLEMLLHNAKGKYIALCDGDDFWILKSKIRKQVELLEFNQNSVMSVGLTYIYKEKNKEETLKIIEIPDKKKLNIRDVYSSYSHTSTYLIKSEIFKDIIKKYFVGHNLFGDTAIRTLLIDKGPFELLPEVVSVYRDTGSGIWSKLDKIQQLIWEYKSTCKLNNILRGEHADIQKNKLYQISRQIFFINIKQKNYLKAFFWFFKSSKTATYLLIKKLSKKFKKRLVKFTYGKK